MPSLPKSPPSPPSLLHHDNSDAERRLRAEERLREAIEELQRRQRRASLGGPYPPCHHGLMNLVWLTLLAIFARVSFSPTVSGVHIILRSLRTGFTFGKPLEAWRFFALCFCMCPGLFVHLVSHLFILFQVMYAFVMRPESLPKAYRDFIQKTGPVALPVYKAVRDSCRAGPVDVASLSAYLSSRGKLSSVKLEEFPSIILVLLFIQTHIMFKS
ncbi:hypothetical protein GH714_025792 [Hevea brasiliensis]|uniref:Uncharacterized protein n=1 Tax=Hevea brasiliensis TaxID=3981 RepID=A0A6A6MDC1_HEVBR|nr:hypothetical protein GH714_025792 [Hevea brasiliensis]